MLEVVMQLVRIAMLYSPIGIFFLIVAKMLEMDDLGNFVGLLGLYMVTVLAKGEKRIPCIMDTTGIRWGYKG